MLQSYHADTPQYLQLGEGVLLRNVDLDGVLLAADPMEKLIEEMTREGALMGATSRGCIFRCVPEMIEALGAKKPFVLCDKNTYKAAGEKVCAVLKDAGIPHTLYVLPVEKPGLQLEWTGENMVKAFIMQEVLTRPCQRRRA